MNPTLNRTANCFDAGLLLKTDSPRHEKQLWASKLTSVKHCLPINLVVVWLRVFFSVSHGGWHLNGMFWWYKDSAKLVCCLFTYTSTWFPIDFTLVTFTLPLCLHISCLRKGTENTIFLVSLLNRMETIEFYEDFSNFIFFFFLLCSFVLPFATLNT